MIRFEGMMQAHPARRALSLLAVLALLCPLAHAAEHITLKNGFELDCVRREAAEGDRVRLYSSPASYLEVGRETIAGIETVPDPAASLPQTGPAAPTLSAAPSAADLQTLLARAGELHRIDADMLASVVKAESGGNVRAVSRTGARGLMQLMPATAAKLGVADSFRAESNIAGGSAYLDQLLTRYHDNIALALAAYNAGPGAVDRWHGIPPFRETQLYVARVIREFNRRKLLALRAGAK